MWLHPFGLCSQLLSAKLSSFVSAHQQPGELGFLGISASSEIKLTQASLFLESLSKMGFLQVSVIVEPSEPVISVKAMFKQWNRSMLNKKQVVNIR